MHTIKNTLEEYSDNKLYQNINLASYIKISQKWNDIMGEVLSKICYPLFFRNAVLTIAVRDSVWANEIFMNRNNIFKFEDWKGKVRWKEEVENRGGLRGGGKTPPEPPFP